MVVSGWFCGCQVRALVQKPNPGVVHNCDPADRFYEASPKDTQHEWGGEGGEKREARTAVQGLGLERRTFASVSSGALYCSMAASNST